eukprot:13356435-Alexandrium_andersonii.AAC.1
MSSGPMLQDTLHCDAVLPADKPPMSAWATSVGEWQACCTWDRTHDAQDAATLAHTTVGMPLVLEVRVVAALAC